MSEKNKKPIERDYFTYLTGKKYDVSLMKHRILLNEIQRMLENTNNEPIVDLSKIVKEIKKE